MDGAAAGLAAGAAAGAAAVACWAACTAGAGPVGIEGVALAFVTSSVTNRASSQSAHLAALRIRSARYTALYCGVREW